MEIKFHKLLKLISKIRNKINLARKDVVNIGANVHTNFVNGFLTN